MTVQLDENNLVVWPDDLTPDETNQINAVASMPDQTGRTLAKAAAAIGGAFLVYQAYMKRRLKKQLKGAEDLPPEQYAAVIQQTFNSFMPSWTYMVTPAIFSSYLSGVELAQQSIASEQLRELALRYSWSLGEYLNGKSIDAAVRGYQAQLNRNINGKIALANIIDAFAVPIPGIRSLVQMWTGREEARVSEAALPSVKKARVNRQIIGQLNERAKLIGDQESFSAQSTGKQLAWSYAQQIGLIPENATRAWETANDERVCPECGPLHGMEMPINQPFEIGKKRFWSPPLHINCRCNVKLKSHLASELGQRLYRQVKEADIVVGKADWDAREHPRDMRTGQFSRSNRGRLRPFQVTYRENPEDYTLQDALADASRDMDLRELDRQAQNREIEEAAARQDEIDWGVKPTESNQINWGISKPNWDIKAEPKTSANWDIGTNYGSGVSWDVGTNWAAKKPNLHLKPITDITPPNTRKRAKKHSYVPLDRPVFAVYDEQSPSFAPWGRPDIGDALGITNVHFSSDPYKIQRWAEDYRREKLGEAKDIFREWSDVPGAIAIPAEQYGEDASYVLDDHDIDNAVAWYERAMARVQHGDVDYDEVPDDFARVRVYDPHQPTTKLNSRWGFPVEHHGGLGRDDVSYRHIVSVLHLEEVVDAMEPRLVRLDHVRDDTDMAYDSDSDSDEPLIQDDFRIEMKWAEGHVGGHKYKVMHLAPIPKSKEFDDED